MDVKKTTMAPAENNQEVQIFIVGPSGIQNELLASFLEKETGYPCKTTSFEGLENLSKDERVLLIFLHGYNVSFDNAALRAAQFRNPLRP